MLKIHYQDEWLLMVDKPAGLPTLPARGGRLQTLAAAISHQFPSQKNIPDAGIVHRLDNDTSGLVVVARSEPIYKQLRTVWNADQVQKRYVALVLGNLSGSGEITTPIGHHPRKKKKMQIASQNLREGVKGREAHTQWLSLKNWPEYTLLEIAIRTGVRHQIRVHCASIGHPLAGDRLYQTARQKSRDHFNLQRHYLHLKEISLPHPATEKPFSVTSLLPPDLLEFIRQLG